MGTQAQHASCWEEPGAMALYILVSGTMARRMVVTSGARGQPWTNNLAGIDKEPRLASPYNV